jgi:ATP-dependent DNA helicase RecQ
MARYCRGAVCRHKALVQHFGQTYDPANCEACDICLGDTQDVPDAVTVAKKILSCVARVKESFGIAHVIDVLRGADTANIRARGHHELTTHGLLKSVPKADLRDWVYQLIGQGVLVQAGDEYPVLKLNQASWDVMAGRASVRLIQLARREKRGGSTAAPPFALPAGADPALFEFLKKLRRQEASRDGVRPYQVLPDTVLAEMARGRPTTEDGLLRISGVGEMRLRSYGRTFLKGIISYCTPRGLPTDVPLTKAPPAPRTASGPVAAPKGEPATAPKPGAKKDVAFKMFRGGASVAEVVQKTELSASTVTEYLADFVRSERPGSIFQWVPEDVCERVAAAAELHGTERLKPVYLELNGEVPYEAIRVVFALLDSRR